MDKDVTDNMEKKKYKYGKIRPPNPDELPTIVVEGPSYDRLPYVDEETQFSEENADKVGELDSKKNENDEDESAAKRKQSLGRRNSISLPNLDEMKVFTDKIDSGPSVETVDSQDDEFQHIGGNRNARRKSVSSPRMLKPGEDIEAFNHSPANSITSVNSIASLLREKIQSLPQTLRKKKSPEYKTKIFVALLFIAIVVLIFTSYFLYQQKLLAKAYFDKIKFNNVQRLMTIYNEEGADVIHATLGTTVNYEKVLTCLPADLRKDGSLCLEWMYRARLYMIDQHLENNVTCYHMNWISLSDHVLPTDCFDMSNAHWYGGGQTAESAWPLERGNHVFHPFITGRVETQEWGNVLKRYFINSKGAAIIVDNETPLYVAIRNSTKGKKELCLRAQFDDFAFVNHEMRPPELNYKICIGSNMSDLHLQLSEHTLWGGLKKEDSNIIASLLTEPVWEITVEDKKYLTEELMSNFTTDINKYVGILKQGHVLINEFWQNQIGDFELDTERFPTLNKTMEMLTRRGFRVVFTIQPFISTESLNFAEAVRKRLLVSERSSDRSIPALTRYKSLNSAAVLDITNERTVPWLLEKLKTVIHKYKIDAFYLDLGEAYNMPHYYKCEKSLLNPDQYKTIFINSLQGSVPIFGVSSTIDLPKPPAFVVLPPVESSWEGLRRIIPTILSYGILGYPFLIPGIVGGDYDYFNNMTMFLSEEKISIPDQELYIRWLQLASFLPTIRYNHLPSSYGNKNISEVAKKLAITRQSKVSPKLKKYAIAALNHGLPIIRPLWMLDAEDPACHLADNQFSIGDEIIVAPILYPNAREREVYLPAGVWKDGIDHSLKKGSRWIHDYKVEENEVAWFERMPDDTRF